MIVDKLENSHKYPFGEAWKKAFEFLNSLSSETEDGKYEIQGEDIYAIVMSYETILRSDAMLESHKKYTDIQATLRGVEGFECHYRDSLIVRDPYDAQKDIEFYETEARAHSLLNISVGYFAMFFPHDAHMPCLAVGIKKEHIKKVVIKIKTELL
ncbi:MAG: YhcH/YjgK/YiaL family protein [Sulfurimonas sp.]|jgi:YhcH/YjgK/YiaL family protein